MENEEITLDLDTDFKTSDYHFYKLSEKRAIEIIKLFTVEGDLLSSVAREHNDYESHQLLVSQLLVNTLQRLKSINEVLFAINQSGRISREAEIICNPVLLLKILVQSNLIGR